MLAINFAEATIDVSALIPVTFITNKIFSNKKRTSF
jgi:hypothetical protein